MVDNCKLLVPDDFTPSSIETAFNYAREILEKSPEIEEVILVIPAKSRSREQPSLHTSV